MTLEKDYHNDLECSESKTLPSKKKTRGCRKPKTERAKLAESQKTGTSFYDVRYGVEDSHTLDWERGLS